MPASPPPPESLTPERVHLWLDQQAHKLLDSRLRDLGADEGSLWIADFTTEELVPILSNSPRADEFVLIHRQPLTSGIVSMVCVSEQPFADTAVFRNQRQDPALDQRLSLRTWAMAAVPFYLGTTCHGVVSAVQLIPADQDNDPRTGFDTAALSALQSLADALGQKLSAHCKS